MKVSDWISIAALVLGSGGFFSGIYLWWSGSIKKNFAAERDFGHIKRNQEQINQSLLHLDQKISETTDNITEKIQARLDSISYENRDIKALLLANLGKKE